MPPPPGPAAALGAALLLLLLASESAHSEYQAGPDREPPSPPQRTPPPPGAGAAPVPAPRAPQAPRPRARALQQHPRAGGWEDGAYGAGLTACPRSVPALSRRRPPARVRAAVMLRAREAAQFLRPRQRRAYQVFEEAKQGHLERECIEELCSQEEAREVFENDPETVSARAPWDSGLFGTVLRRVKAARVPGALSPQRCTGNT